MSADRPTIRLHDVTIAKLRNRRIGVARGNDDVAVRFVRLLEPGEVGQEWRDTPTQKIILGGRGLLTRMRMTSEAAAALAVLLLQYPDIKAAADTLAAEQERTGKVFWKEGEPDEP